MLISLFSTTTCVYHKPPLVFTAFQLRRSSPPFSADFNPRFSFRRRAISPGRPPPPESDKNDSGPASTTKFQESTRIFFAVLFWMALFFWSAIWDGRDNDGGTSMRSRKGSWFRR